MQAPPNPGSEAEPIERFLALLARSLQERAFFKLMLGRYRGQKADLVGVTVRRLTLRGEDCLSFVHRYTTRDLTTNLPLAQGLAAVGEALREGFEHAHLLTSKPGHPARAEQEGPAPVALRQGRQRAGRAAGARPREAPLPRPEPPVPGGARRHRRAASPHSGDVAQVEADQQVRRDHRPRASLRGAGADGTRSAWSISAAARPTSRSPCTTT